MKLIIILFILFSFLAHGQLTENGSKKDTFFKNEIVYELQTIGKERKKIRSLIIPVSLITYGFISLDEESLQSLDNSIKNDIREDHPFFHTNVDNFLQYTPAIGVYGLNAIGI